MTNNPKNMNKFCHMVSEELHSKNLFNKYEQILSYGFRSCSHKVSQMETINMSPCQGVSGDNISHDLELSVRIARSILESSPFKVNSSQPGCILSHSFRGEYQNMNS
jgi:hypothetical protein